MITKEEIKDKVLVSIKRFEDSVKALEKAENCKIANSDFKVLSIERYEGDTTPTYFRYNKREKAIVVGIHGTGEYKFIQKEGVETDYVDMITDLAYNYAECYDCLNNNFYSLGDI